MPEHVAENTNINDALLFEEISAPSAPAANKLAVYAKDDGGVTKFAIKDSAGTETILGGGGSTTGSGANTRLAYWTGASSLSSDDALTWNETDNLLLIAGGTITGGSKPGLSITQTWNDAGVDFAAATVNITNTTSAAGSSLLNLQKGGVDVFTFGKDGKLTATSGTITTSQPLTITQTWNDGAETFRAIEVDITNTDSGSGSEFVNLKVGGLTKLYINKTGALKSADSLEATTYIVSNKDATVVDTPSIYASSSAGAMAIGASSLDFGERLKINGPRSTGGGAGSATNRTSVVYQLAGTYLFQTTAQTGNVHSWNLEQVTLENPSAGTIPVAASLYLAGAPIAGTNVTITTPLTLWVDAGTSRFDGLVDFNGNNDPALGGGASATLGTIGGSGPATATQNKWLKVQVDGVDAFIPVWV